MVKSVSTSVIAGEDGAQIGTLLSCMLGTIFRALKRNAGCHQLSPTTTIFPSLL